MKRQIRCLIWSILFFVCVSCQLLQPSKRRPYVEIVYTVNGVQKQFQEDKHGGYGLAEKYWAGFERIDDGLRAHFVFTGCYQQIILNSDEGEAFFIEGKHYNNDSNWGVTYFSGTGDCRFETGWFSFHTVDDGTVCYELIFDSEWVNVETGKTVIVTGKLYVYDKYYGKFVVREYRDFIITQ